MIAHRLLKIEKVSWRPGLFPIEQSRERVHHTYLPHHHYPTGAMLRNPKTGAIQNRPLAALHTAPRSKSVIARSGPLDRASADRDNPSFSGGRGKLGKMRGSG